MPVLRPEVLERELAAGRRGGVFFLFGEDEYGKEEAVAALVAAHLDPATRDFNFDQLRGSEIGEETLASAIATPPLMAEWRVVLVREAQALASSARMRGIIEGVLARPVAGLALILVATIPDQSKAQFYQRLRKDAVAVEFPALAPADVPGVLMERAARLGFALDADAARELAEAIGPDLGVLMAELGKLRDYAAGRTRVGVEDVRAVTGRIERQNRWAWFDLVGGRRFAEARAALPALFDAGETGVGLLLGLGTQFLRLALAAAGGESALQAELPPNQRWLASRLVRQARSWTLPALDAALEDLLRADRLLKSAPLSDRHVIEELLLRLEARAAVPAPT